MSDKNEMENFVGYQKARTYPLNEMEGSLLPNWANTPQMAILMLNLTIILLGLVVSLTLSDVTSGEGNSTILSFFGKC
tara:strand:+ start:1373 stop:1606 length:234 start_codon:yes stop_codon:yes gene_type:complete